MELAEFDDVIKAMIEIGFMLSVGELGVVALSSTTVLDKALRLDFATIGQIATVGGEPDAFAPMVVRLVDSDGDALKWIFVDPRPAQSADEVLFGIELVGEEALTVLD